MSLNRTRTRPKGGAKAPSVAVFAMPERGHFERLLPLVSGLAGLGAAVHVFTDGAFRSRVERAGGRFVDLFAGHSVEEADAESMPVPCRFVTFAGRFGGAVIREAGKVGPSLIVHDTFAVIGPVVANALRLPRVNVCAGHDMDPARYLRDLERDPRKNISGRCLKAVEVLRKSYGLADASPFSYVSTMSPDLNVYGEPPEFLAEDKRAPFEPIAFYGSLPSFEGKERMRPGRGSLFGPGSAAKLKVYVSLGTIVWRYYSAAALRALTTFAGFFAGRSEARVVVSLGKAKIGREARRALARRNVAVRSYVNQRGVLAEADVFITHQGLNSTHEAIFHRVPMISYPFFTDQPSLAKVCSEMGLAIPLTDAPRADFDEKRVGRALDRLAAERGAMLEALSKAREWERAVIAGRPEVHRRIIELSR